MDATQKTVIQHKWVYLLETVDVKGTMLLDYLLQYKVLNQHQVEQVTVEQLTKDKVAKLLEILQRHPEGFSSLLRALEETNQGHVAETLRRAFQPQQAADGDTNRLV